jgi:hypothetical protein
MAMNNQTLYRHLSSDPPGQSVDTSGTDDVETNAESE